MKIQALLTIEIDRLEKAAPLDDKRDKAIWFMLNRFVAKLRPIPTNVQRRFLGLFEDNECLAAVDFLIAINRYTTEWIKEGGA